MRMTGIYRTLRRLAVPTIVLGLIYLTLWLGFYKINRLLFGAPLLVPHAWNTAVFAMQTLVVLIWISYLLPRKQRNWSGRRAVARKLLTWVVLPVFVVGFAYYTAQIQRIYALVKGDLLGWEGQVYMADEWLGYKPVPGKTGYARIPFSEKMPVRFDENGFRSTLYERQHRDTSILFLGCSYTFGDKCRADHLFSFYVGDSLRYKAVNAGMIGYGLAQILLRSRELIPRLQPRYVVVQQSPWLPQRAVVPYSPGFFSTVTVPRITLEQGAAVVHKPVYPTKIFDLPMHRFMESGNGLLDNAAFYFQVGIPLLSYNEFHKYKFKWQAFRGKLPFHAYEEAASIESYVYSEISGLCQEYGSEMIILRLSNGIDQNADIDESYTHNGLKPLIVDADSLLWARLDAGSLAEYEKVYKHWRVPDQAQLDRYGPLFHRAEGTDSVLIDGHPNELAHSYIAAGILEAISRREAVRSSGTRPPVEIQRH